MQIEPNRLFPIAIPTEGLKVTGVAPAKSAKHVQERTLTTLVMQPHAPIRAGQDIAEQEEQRHDTHLHGERRTYCRRFERILPLIDFRFGFDRRRVSQRADDLTDHVDEVV